MPTAASSAPEPDDDITGLLHRFQQGDSNAKDLLVSTVYRELKMIAARYMRREKGDHTLQTTALVNEAYMKLVNLKDTQWNNRSHFFAVAAQMMRRILVDHARENIADKRGGGHGVLQLDEALVFAPAKSQDMVKLDDALTRLEESDPRAARVVELRFFGGLSIEETAEAMTISPRTVKREWMFAKAWLRNEFGLGNDGNDAAAADPDAAAR
jgi:RNA polymerase sigma-70 factor, ECF subfamily